MKARSAIFARAASEWNDMRAEFDVVLEAAYRAAEEGVGGAMLNERGRREHVSAYSLLTGPWVRVLAYGSPELVEHFHKVGRPSLSDFEHQWVEARNAHSEY